MNLNSFYNEQIVASDPEDISLYSHRRLTIEIEDVNDNSPVFYKSDYDFFIPPYQTLGSIIASIKATDADFQKENNRIMYSLVRGGLDRFSLDSWSGMCDFISCEIKTGSLFSACKRGTNESYISLG